MNTDRLDEFYWNYRKDAKHAKVWKVFGIIFILLHGQAAVEREFSVNSKLLVENLQEKILVASRFVYSSIQSDANHFSELFLSPDWNKVFGQQECDHQLYLEEQRKLDAKSDKAKNRKAVEEEISKVKCKWKLLNKCIQAVSLKADILATEAEVKHNFTLLAKSNVQTKDLQKWWKREKVVWPSACFEKKLKFME